MRKMTMLMAFAAVAGATAVQAQGGTPPDHQQHMQGRGPGGRGGPGGGFGMNQMLFKGITLTDAQKAKLDQLHEAERAKLQGQRGQGAGNFEALREARQKGDTATVQRLMQAQHAQMLARRDTQVAAIRGILTNDQLAQFDANVAEFKKRQTEMGPGRGPGGAGRHGRGGHPPTL